MKKLLPLACLALAACSSAPTANEPPRTMSIVTCAKATSAQAPVPIWSRESFLAPESAAYEAAKKAFYVTNVVGDAAKKDGKGWISRIGADGRDLVQKWSKGKLHAPKGVVLSGGVVWTADIDRVVGFDVKTGKQVEAVAVLGSHFLNDLVADAQGRLVVTDMLDGRVYRIQGRLVEPLAQGPHLEQPNGILFDGGKFVLAGWGRGIRDDFSTQSPGHVLVLDPAHPETAEPWGPAPTGNLDGLAWDGLNALIVSDWMAGKVYRATKSGECILLLEGIPGAADLTFVPETRTLVVPSMLADRIVAYKLPAF